MEGQEAASVLATHAGAPFKLRFIASHFCCRCIIKLQRQQRQNCKNAASTAFVLAKI